MAWGVPPRPPSSKVQALYELCRRTFPPLPAAGAGATPSPPPADAVRSISSLMGNGASPPPRNWSATRVPLYFLPTYAVGVERAAISVSSIPSTVLPLARLEQHIVMCSTLRRNGGRVMFQTPSLLRMLDSEMMVVLRTTAGTGFSIPTSSRVRQGWLGGRSQSPTFISTNATLSLWVHLLTPIPIIFCHQNCADCSRCCECSEL
jgi:hypothetical protein